MAICCRRLRDFSPNYLLCKGCVCAKLKGCDCVGPILVLLLECQIYAHPLTHGVLQIKLKSVLLRYLLLNDFESQL